MRIKDQRNYPDFENTKLSVVFDFNIIIILYLCVAELKLWQYKINYDGAISNAENKAGIGVVVRDCNGEVMASLIQQLEQAYQPVKVEAIVACRAVEFGSEIGVDCAIVEGDSKVIVKDLSNNDNGLTPFAPLINDVSLFLGLFSELSYSNIRRDGNKVAHSLARLALMTPGCTMWMEDVLSRTLPFVQADLAVL